MYFYVGFGLLEMAANNPSLHSSILQRGRTFEQAVRDTLWMEKKRFDGLGWAAFNHRSTHLGLT